MMLIYNGKQSDSAIHIYGFFFIFSTMVSSLVSGTRLLLAYFSVSVERAIEED